MKIASPLSRIREVAPLAKAGADEFYCCVAPEAWRSSYGMVESISRRNNPFAHLNSYEDLRTVKRRADRYGVKVHVALNEAYHGDQIEYLLRQIELIADTGVDALILGDVASLAAVRDSRYEGKIFMGTGGTIFNRETVKFYKSLGVSRMILPRHLSVKEIDEIISGDESLEYEVFMFRGLCPYVDGYCRFQHGINETLKRKPRVDISCSLCYRLKTESDSGRIDSEFNKKVKKKMSPRQSLTGCGLCALYDLRKIPGITALKIVGREFSSNEKLEDVMMVKKMMNRLEEEPGISREGFIRECRAEFSDFFERECSPADCYYPEYFD